MNNVELRGIGMTSQRTRDRLAKTLIEMCIKSEAVLDVIRKTPRHFFIDEALASRAYDLLVVVGFDIYTPHSRTDLAVDGREVRDSKHRYLMQLIKIILLIFLKRGFLFLKLQKREGWLLERLKAIF